MDHPQKINSGVFDTGHCQGIAVDTERGFVYYSFTTVLVKTDLQGRLVGSVGGLLGHLGCIDFHEADGRVYGSLEYKHDSIGQGIFSRVGGAETVQDGFYMAVFDADRIDRPGMDACRDGVMRAVFLREVLDWYAAPGHRFGCSGIDGTAFGPMFGAEPGSKEYLCVACGIYSDPGRADNDCQILLCYDTDGWEQYLRPLSQEDAHRSGPAAADRVFFVYTGNTTYGVQNLEYDAFTRKWWMAVYPGNKPGFPNPPLFAIDGTVPPRREAIPGTDISGEVLTLDGRGLNGYPFPHGSTGLFAFGDGRYYISLDGKEPGGYMTDVCLYGYREGEPFVRDNG